MYIDIDSRNQISINGLTPEEALRLSMIIRLADSRFLTGPLTVAGDQLYLHATRAFDSILKVEKKVPTLKE